MDDRHGYLERKGSGDTQFGRAMRHLGIELICANTPQAKGRVERANGILQDRLVKELRLQGISDLRTANHYLLRFIKDYNQRFSVAPTSSSNAHRKAMPKEEVLDLIFSFHYSRKLSKNLEMSFNNTLYQIKTETSAYAMRGARITVCVNEKNEITLLYKGNILEYTTHNQQKKPTAIVSTKEINSRIDALKVDPQTRGHKPKKDHPW